jgi:hypothetical protein
MSVNWNQEWVIDSSNVSGLSKDDKVKFDGTKIMLQKKGEPFASWGSYSSTAAKTRLMTLGSADYTIQYEHNLDKLICTINPEKPGDTASARSLARLLRWIAGGILGMGVGLGVGVLLGVPWGSALAVAFAAAVSAAMATKAASNADSSDHGPGGTSWTAIEGG